MAELTELDGESARYSPANVGGVRRNGARQPGLPVVECRGVIVDIRGIDGYAQADRPAPGNSRSAGPENHRPRAAAWGIAKRIQILSNDILSVGQGSLYPALHRLEQQGWITAEWKDSDLGRPAKFYALTRQGRKQLDRELKTWQRLSSAVHLLIENA